MLLLLLACAPAPDRASMEARSHARLGAPSTTPTLPATGVTSSDGGSGDTFGIDVAVGDLDGDTIPDLVVGTGREAVYRYRGSTSGIDLATEAVSLASDGVEGDGFGRVVRVADLDGDGVGDLVVGAPGVGAGAGAVYLYVGGVEAVVRASDGAPGDAFGAALDAGDVNGDGLADLVVGAPGRVYLYAGAPGGVDIASESVLAGTAADGFGARVALLGDTDGDGFGDLAVGAAGADSSAGAVSLYRGGASGLDPASEVRLVPSFAAAGAAFGTDVAAGDFDGDGLGDLAVGAHEAAFVYLGGASGIDASTQDRFVASDRATGDSYGLRVAGADLDEDGADELIVAAPGDDDGGAESGAAYVYYGSVEGKLAAPTPTDGASFGSALARGDLDSDGTVDLVVGAPGGAGEVYVFAGGCDDADGDGWSCDDCDDADPAVSPDATEACNGIDDNCDGHVDEGVVADWYPDADGDLYGSASGAVTGCEAPAGYVGVAGDCDDGNPAVHRGAAEVCDSGDVDEDCDGLADDADASVDLATGSTFYVDADGDGYAGTAVQRCDLPTGADTVSTDCNDASRQVSPARTEICDGAGTDEDCDGLVDDADPSLDRTTGATWYVDEDGDGVGGAIGGTTCVAPAGSADRHGDCDDTNASVNPGATEICDAANTDEDCDGVADDDDHSVDATTFTSWYKDNDGDGWGDREEARCDPAEGWVTVGGDCDDGHANVNPGELEVCDGADRDENCNGLADDDDPTLSDPNTYYPDWDGDGYGNTIWFEAYACEAPEGYVANNQDCDDTRAEVNPHVYEVCNGRDDNCDGLTDDSQSVDDPPWYRDGDHDGYGDPDDWIESCDQPNGRVANGDDCDDTTGGTHPGAAESCFDGIDRDCDGRDNDESCEAESDDSSGKGCICSASGSMMFGLFLGVATRARRRR